MTWISPRVMGAEPGLPGISIVIPAWNEEDRLARTLERDLPSLGARGDPFEVIVVVDGVRDPTAGGADQHDERQMHVLWFLNGSLRGWARNWLDSIVSNTRIGQIA